MLEMKKKLIFGTSLNPVLPPILSAWSCDYGILPKSHPICFQGLCFQKKGGCYWTTAKSILSVDKQEDGGISFVKAQIKKSFGDQICPATILFQGSIPL